jgi:hypothetical protein
MIRKIVLENFMSHARTEIDLAEGLTVLVGPNNCGKSAVVAALEAVCGNTRGNFMIRHGERRCRVTVVTDEHVVAWERTRDNARYEIDGKRVDRLRGGLPDDLHDFLRLPAVEDDGKEFDVHVGAQKSPIFLLDEPASSAATFFASSSDAGKLLRMQRLHKERTLQARRDHKRLTGQRDRVDAILATLDPLDELQKSVEAVEREHGRLGSLAAEIEDLEGMCSLMAGGLGQQDRHRRLCRALEALQEPPVLHGVDDLARLCRSVEQASRSLDQARLKSEALVSLHGPPELQDTDLLASACRRLAEAFWSRKKSAALADLLAPLDTPPVLYPTEPLVSLLAAWEKNRRAAKASGEVAGALGALEEAPEPSDTRPLAQLVRRLEAAGDQRRGAKGRHRKAEEEMAVLRGQIEEWAQAHPACPTCGGALDAEQILASIDHPGGDDLGDR